MHIARYYHDYIALQKAQKHLTKKTLGQSFIADTRYNHFVQDVNGFQQLRKKRSKPHMPAIM